MNASMARKTTPAIRNGKAMSHTSGSSTRVANARGQQSTKRMHQATKRISAFMPGLYRLSGESSMGVRAIAEIRIDEIRMMNAIAATPQKAGNFRRPSYTAAHDK